MSKFGTSTSEHVTEHALVVLHLTWTYKYKSGNCCLQPNFFEAKQIPFNHLAVHSHYFSLKASLNRDCWDVTRALNVQMLG